MKRTKKTGKLLLNSEKVRELKALTKDQLDRVAGGNCDDSYCSFTSATRNW
jgi:hypothetical protein